MNIDSVSQELDRLYQFEINQYITRCDELKKSGYKIYRNDNGQHKVVFSGQSSEQDQQQFIYDDVKTERAHKTREARKNNIFVRAKNKIKGGFETFKSIVGFIKYLYSFYKRGQKY